MDGSEINTVVNNLADRLGVAAERLMPVAEQAVGEMALRNWICAAGAGAVALLVGGAATCVVWALGGLDDKEDTAVGRTIAIFIGFVLLLCTSAIGIDCLSRALSPTITLLESLK